MKCSGCGANFSSRLKACPYCGTVNNEALLREREREERRQLLKRLRVKTLREAEPKIVLQVLNRVILCLVALWVLMIGAVYVVSAVGERREEAKKASVSLEDHRRQLEELKAEEKYDELAEYLGEYHLSMYEEGMEPYWQLYELHRDMRDFWERAEAIEALSQEAAVEDEWRYRSFADSVCEIWKYGSSQYEWDLILPENEELYGQWREQVFLYLRACCGLSEEEIGTWLEEKELSYENAEQFGDFLKRRAADGSETEF